MGHRRLNQRNTLITVCNNEYQAVQYHLFAKEKMAVLLKPVCHLLSGGSPMLGEEVFGKLMESDVVNGTVAGPLRYNCFVSGDYAVPSHDTAHLVILPKQTSVYVFMEPSIPSKESGVFTETADWIGTPADLGKRLVGLELRDEFRDKIIRFIYDGGTEPGPRVIKCTGAKSTKGGNILLEGYDLLAHGQMSKTFRNYCIDKILGDIEIVDFST